MEKIKRVWKLLTIKIKYWIEERKKRNKDVSLHSVFQNTKHSSNIDVELSEQNIGNRVSFNISKIAEEDKSF